MESSPSKHEVRKSPEGASIPVELSYSRESEAWRIRWTVGRYPWYKENGYKPALPQSIINRLEGGEEVSDSDIASAVEGEYQDEIYARSAEEFKKLWDAESEDFFKKLRALGRPFPEKYDLTFTRYGVGGSYGYPNAIQLNLSNLSGLDLLHVTFHEIVHLTIEDLIKKYEIPHWTKERLVNLIMNRFFPDKAHLQRDPEGAEQISEIFDREFPNIEKIIELVPTERA